MPKLSLEAFKQQRDKFNHRIQSVEARERAAQRKQDLQRKILVGGYVLKKAEQEGQLQQMYAETAGCLTRDIDCKLFELSSNEKNRAKKKHPKAVKTSEVTNANTKVV